MKRTKWIPILAIAVLLIGITASVYAFARQNNATSVTVNGEAYKASELLGMAEERTVEEYSGAALDDLMINLGVPDPETKAYTLIAADGYQKTVTWENMQNGLLTADMMSVFSDLAKAFRIKDIVEIKAE